MQIALSCALAELTDSLTAKERSLRTLTATLSSIAEELGRMSEELPWERARIEGWSILAREAVEAAAGREASASAPAIDADTAITAETAAPAIEQALADTSDEITSEAAEGEIEAIEPIEVTAESAAETETYEIVVLDIEAPATDAADIIVADDASETIAEIGETTIATDAAVEDSPAVDTGLTAAGDFMFQDWLAEATSEADKSEAPVGVAEHTADLLTASTETEVAEFATSEADTAEVATAAASPEVAEIVAALAAEAPAGEAVAEPAKPAAEIVDLAQRRKRARSHRIRVVAAVAASLAVIVTGSIVLGGHLPMELSSHLTSIGSCDADSVMSNPKCAILAWLVL